MKIPDWLEQPLVVNAMLSVKKQREKFLDKTLRHVTSFIENTMFNEMTSSKNGFLQKIEPRIKVLTIMVFIILSSLQKSIAIISAFFFVSLILALASKIPLQAFILRLIPAFILTLLISMPASLNLIVNGEPVIRLFALKSHYDTGIVTIPGEISITKQGILSAMTLLLRVIASVSLVFLLTMTTRPESLIKAVSSFMPDLFRSMVSVSYRYIFFLVRKIEQFIIGFKSRNISTSQKKGSITSVSTEQRWVASRIGLLFSISIRLSRELGYAMESRGYKHENLKLQTSDFKLLKNDVVWLIFSIMFTGVIIWKSLA